MFFFTLILLISCEIVPSINNVNDNPFFHNENRHLTIKAPKDKHIFLKTNGQGAVHINGVNLKNVSAISSNLLNTLTKYKQKFEITQDKIQKLETALNEEIPRNSSPTTLSTSRNQIRISNIGQKLRSLDIKITFLTLELIINECDSNPCKNGGTCQDLFGKFHCLCPKEWEGSTCELDVNECRLMGTDLGCQNGATCINKPGTYKCACMPGWYGMHCTQRSTDCNSGSSTELCGHGTCIPQNSQTGYKCLCDQGWTTDGKALACNVDVNECTGSRPVCSVNPPVPCVNLPGSFTCGTCPAGYVGNGYYCSDVNECSTDNGGCSTSPQVQCVNTFGSYYCGHCPPGYSGDGKVCEYQGVCNVNNGGCHPSATCRDNSNISWNYVNCVCPLGFTGSGVGPNGCIPLRTSPCQPNPCHHGTCSTTNTAENYRCDCHESYTGRNCDKLTTACDSNPCQNGGTCISLVAPLAYRCACSVHYAGLRCEDERQACGGRLAAPEGQLVFPSLNSQTHQRSTSCVWTIETNSTQVLNLTFTKFNLEKSRGCQDDSLEIHDGESTMAHMLGRFCGMELANDWSIVSTHNVITLWLRSNRSIGDGGGFQLNWTSIEPTCGGSILNSSYGTIQSPGSPGNYPNNRDCYWRLQAGFGKRFQFHFFTLMIGDNPDCDSDYVEFFSRKDLGHSFDTFGRFCNTSHPPPLFSPSSYVTIHFHSDAANTYPGFQISYSVENAVPGCGETFTAFQGEIRSPRITASNFLCEYKIKAPLRHRIKIKFESFSVASTQYCQFNSVAIYSGGSQGEGLVARLCGNDLPSHYVVDEREILIVFVSTDRDGSQDGFVLNYELFCAEKFVEPSGVIKSFNYQNWGAKSCVYEIVQPIGTVIELNVLTKFYSLSRSFHSILEIRDGDSENATLIGKYENKPPLIISSYNCLWLKYTDRLGLMSGLSANYTTKRLGCGGILKTKTGTIASPNHSDLYASDSKCQWIISAPPGQVIQIFFTMLHLDKSYNCFLNFLEIFDYNSKSSHNGSMGKFCGHQTPPTLLSTSNVVTVNFETHSSITSGGFLATYKFVRESAVCGGNYFSNAGQVKSPNYPDLYPSEIECSWTITVAAGHQIMLHVSNFSLEITSDCQADLVEIRNGGSSTSPLIGRYCGTDIPKLIPSHANKIFIKFKSDPYVTRSGFKIYWDSTTTGCGGTLYAPTGSIISPNYPEPYNANAECIWRISVNAGSSIQIVFSDFEISENSTCSLDYIEIFDGPSMSSKSLGRFCATHPSYLNSTSNHLTIKFRSDVDQEGRGFQLQYNTICNVTLRGFNGVIESPNFPKKYPYHLNCNWNIRVDSRNNINISFSHFDVEFEPINTNNSCGSDYLKIEQRPFTKAYEDLEWTLDGCGSILTQPTGTIQSPNYPRSYKAYTECNWLIQANYGNSIEITFNDLDLEKDYDCTFERVVIYNGKDETFPEIAKICHSTKAVTFSSSGNFIYVKFKSNGEAFGRGFSANYKNQPSKCGGKFAAKKGIITSPNYPQNYDHNDTCSYLIEVHEGHRISLKIEDLDLFKPMDLNCSKINSSYLEVFDGPSTAYPLLGKLCGIVENITFESTNNHMFLEFVSSTETTAKGFKAKYEMACGSRIETSGSGDILISSNDFAGAVTHQLICSWTIVSNDPSKHVSLSVSSYYSIDFKARLEIYDGESSKAPLLGSYYVNKLPPMITSEGRALHITVNGFEVLQLFATYSVYDSACGGVLAVSEGSFSSPGYPKRYPIDAQCEWVISMPQGISVGIYFKEFSLLESEHCNTDYLEVRKNNNTGSLLGIFCGTNTPENITSFSGDIWILLKTSRFDGDSTGVAQRGFLADFVINYSNELFGSKGVIESPSLLYLKEFVYSFTWKITVTFQKRILISFKKFSIGYEAISDICYSGVLKIFDGEDENYPSLGEFCGDVIPEPITSGSNVIFIKTTHHSLALTSGDFEIEWLEIESKADEPLSQSKENNCNSPEPINLNLLKNYTVISSPGYPNGYAISLNCEWIISTIPMNHLRLDFLAMDLEKVYYSNCINDYVEIFQKRKTDSDWESISKYCFDNATSEHVEIDSNLMKILFVSNTYVNETGFSAKIIEECGGNLNDANGFIIFDNTTKRIESYNQTCEWNIAVRAGKTIEVEFIKFNLLQDTIDQTCLNYVMLRNGNSRNSPLLGDGKFCGTQTPPLLRTVGNHLHVKFYGTVKSSFIMEYREIGANCKRQITLTDFAKSEQISSPNYPNIPEPHTECFWTVMAPPGETIRIDFTGRFDLFTNKDCTKEYVEIRDGGTVFSKLIGRFCQEMPSSQISTDNFMFINLFTDVDDPNNGFQATVSISKCGGTIRGQSGELQSPFFNHPDKYPIDYNCTWRFSGPRDHIMKIKFNALDLGNSPFCTGNDSVEISEENILPRGSKEIILGRFCGNKLPKTNIDTFENQAIIRFKSGKEQRHFKGFSISFQTNPKSCGGNIFQPSGIISSPSYAFSAQLKTCSWLITVPRGRRITLELINQDFTAASGVSLDFYNTPKASFLVSTAESSFKSVKSSENTLYIVYRSDQSNIGNIRKGFRAKYASNMPTICQGDFNQTEGVFTQPTEILPSYTCTYLHERNVPGTTLAINIKTVSNVAESNECDVNRGTVKLTTGYMVLQRSFCDLANMERSPFPNNALRIISDFDTQLNYTVSYKSYPCGGIINKEIGTISSPNFPNKSLDSLECTWLINLRKEQSIQLIVNDLKLGDDCTLNYLDIYNGDSTNDPKFGRYCQNNKPNTIKSETNQVRIEYKFDKLSNGGGFSLKYEPIIQGCGGTFSDRSRIIQTPNYPSPYQNNAECLWELHSPQGYHIGLRFISRFEIEKSDNCTKDFVEIWDWRDNGWFSYGKQCGREIRGFNSTSNKLKIMFRSNDRNSGTGFRAEWEWNCGGEFPADKIERFIASPGYPSGHLSNNSLTCEYNITTPVSPTNYYITLRFDDFVLGEENTNCNSNNLTISDTYNPPPYALSRTYCGTNKPPMIQIVRNIFIKLKLNPLFSEKGFKFAYQLEDCGGNISEPSTIKSPLFYIPRSNFHAGYFDCLWNITAPKNKIIKLDFEYFNMFYQSSCYVNNIEIYDGREVTDKRLGTLCGDLSDNPPAFVSSTNAMIVKTMVDRNQPQVGYKAVVFFTDGPEAGCGGVKDVNATSPLNLASPNLENLDCSWTITAPEDHNIQINFTELNLRSLCASGRKSNCSCSILEITDGDLIRNAPFETLCGVQTNNLQKSISTSGNKASIRFFGRDMKKIGFRATISTSISACGHSMLTPTAEEQTITSPNFPNSYPPNMRCVWYLRASQRIQIHFKSLDLEKTPRCDGDRVEIIDVDAGGYYSYIENAVAGFRRNTTDFLWYRGVFGIYKFCGTTDNHTFEYYSNGYQVEIAFTSFAKPGKGFSLEYHLASCSRNYTAEQGRIQISGSENCSIAILVPENRTISIYFQQFSVYPAVNCEYGSVEITDGISKNSSSLLLKDCGYELPNPVFSTSNQVSLRNWINLSVYPHDVDLLYTSTDAGRGCGGTVFNYRGRIYSPLYPAPYRGSTECVWNVRVTPGLRVALKFEVFDIQGDCDKNYVKVRTVSDDSSPDATQQFCKTDTPATLYSAEKLTISYKSSLKNRGRGFLALFEAITY